MKTSDWIGLHVQAASEIVTDAGIKIPEGAIMIVKGARVSRLTLVDAAGTLIAENVSMGAVKFLPRS